MHSSLSIIKENEKEGVDDAGSSQRLMHLFHVIGPLIQAGPPLRPPTVYPANWFCPAPDAQYPWPKHPSESAPLVSHTRVSLLGARIPQELFDYIIKHIWPKIPTCRTLAKTKTSFSFAWSDPFAQEGLRTCSQVCRHWANKCRRYMFTGAVLVISSPEDMDEFIQYAMHGCPSLIPLYKVIAGISVLQRYDATRSFCHRLHSLHATLHKVPGQMLKLKLLGPVPKSIPSHMLKTPHWSIPPTVPAPPSLLSNCDNVVVGNVHMASFSDAAQFVRHFSMAALRSGPYNIFDGYAESIQYRQVTWDDSKCIPHRPAFRKPILRQRPYTPNYVHIQAHNCTDNVRLCTYTAVARPTFAMHWMQEDERQWIFSLMTSFNQFLDIDIRGCIFSSDLQNFDGHQWPRISWQLRTVYESNVNRTRWKGSRINLSGDTVTVAFYLDRLPQDAPAFSVRVVGLEVVLPFPIDFSALLALVRSCPTRLVINFRFPEVTCEGLQRCLKGCRPINWNPQIEAHTMIFTNQLSSEDSDGWSRTDSESGLEDDTIEPGLEDDWTRIDPVTLSPTGQTWRRHEDIIPSLVSEQSQDNHHVL